MAKTRVLETINDLKKALAYIWNEVNKGHMDIEKGRGLGYITSLMFQAIEKSDFEERLKKLEEDSRKREENMKKWQA